MRALMNQSRTRAPWSAALVSLLLLPAIGWSQVDTAGGGALADNLGSMLGSNQADRVFEHFVDLSNLAVAWKDGNSSLMTDCALQFAEGERVLLRSHTILTASQALDLAIRMANEKKDKDSLARLAKALERSGDKDRLAQVNLSLKAAGASRALDPVLAEGDYQAQAAIKDVLEKIQSARVAGSKAQLEALEKSLADLPITDKHRSALKKSIAEAAESLGANNITTAAAQLDRLSGISRPVGEPAEPEGIPYRPLDYTGEFPVGEQVDAFAESLKNVKNPDEPPIGDISQLSKLSGVSRLAGWTDQRPFGDSREYAYSAYGVGSIYQYTNNPGKYYNYNCGQAAVATLLTYHRKYGKDGMRANGTTKLQDILEGSFPPNIIKIKVGGKEYGGGTTPDVVMKCANNYGLNTWIMSGYETELKKWVGWGYPCICVVDCAKAGWGIEGLHYTVVYAHNSTHFWCTNWKGSAKVPRATFKKGWVTLPMCDFILTQPKR